MQELIYLILGQFMVSLLMGLGALCLFVWAVASGLLNDVEPVKYQVLDIEQGPAGQGYAPHSFDVILVFLDGVIYPFEVCGGGYLPISYVHEFFP